MKHRIAIGFDYNVRRNHDVRQSSSRSCPARLLAVGLDAILIDIVVYLRLGLFSSSSFPSLFFIRSYHSTPTPLLIS